jgi:glycosyltransferase involved in cell wall biosynthesis
MAEAASPLKVAIVTPYFREDEAVLHQCHASVAAQTHPATHIMVADGNPSPAADSWPVRHIRLPIAHGDNGNTPRAIGSLAAVGEGFDAIAYLDADNWFQPRHIEAMVALAQRTGAAVCSANRTIHRLDGTVLYWDLESNGRTLVDTSCYFLTRRAFRLVALWGLMPKQLSPYCDRVFLTAVNASGLPRAHSRDATVAFRSRYADHYAYCGEIPPPGAITSADYHRAWQEWNALPAEVRESWNRYFTSGGWA